MFTSIGQTTYITKKITEMQTNSLKVRHAAPVSNVVFKATVNALSDSIHLQQTNVIIIIHQVHGIIFKTF